VASASAFIVHLALRSRTVALGYELGEKRTEQARLREAKRVLSLEAASYQTPERIELVARSLLGMAPPSADRVIALRTPSPVAAPRPVVRDGDDPSEPGQAPSSAPSGAGSLVP
jgi:cell division protein FtsL